MNTQKVALFISFTLLVGCRPAGVIQLPTPQGGAPQGTAVQQDAQARKGSLSIAVKWPERSLPGFNAQVIPKTTKALLLGIADADDNQVYYELIQRPEQGTDPARREIFLNEGNGYKVKVEAYEGFGTDNQGNVTTAGYKRVAAALKTGIEIKWNQKTPVPLPLDAEYAPAISGLFVDQDAQLLTDHAGAGAELFLTGNNLTWNSGEGHGQPEVVFPSGKVATALTEGAGDKLRFTVPTGAGSGNLFLRVNGIPSAATSFQEVASLNFTAAKGGEDQALDDFLGDGVVRSWLGESFPFTSFGYDSLGSYMVSVRARWSNSSAAVGAINPATGAYKASTGGGAAFGEDTITAKTGNVTFSRKVVVAPPAGKFIGLATPASNPSGGLSVAKINDNRFIGAWFSKADNHVHWQLFDADGALPGTHHAIQAVARDKVRMVRVAVQGNDALVAYTLNNGFGLVSVDAQTGAVNRALATPDIPEHDIIMTFNKGDEGGGDDKHFYQLANLASNGSNYMVTYYSMDGNGTFYFNYRMIDLDGETLINPARGQIAFGPGISALDPTQDSFGLSVKPNGNYVAVYHLRVNGLIATKMLEFNQQGQLVSQGGGDVRADNRIMALDGDGAHYLSAAVENNAKIKAYMHSLLPAEPNKDCFPRTGEAIEIDSVGLGVANPLENPTSVVWTGSEYLVAYTKFITDNNGQTQPCPMVRALDAQGKPLAVAHPIAKVGTSATLVATGEGAMAFWITGNNNVVARRLKYH